MRDRQRRSGSSSARSRDCRTCPALPYTCGRPVSGRRSGYRQKSRTRRDRAKSGYTVPFPAQCVFRYAAAFPSACAASWFPVVSPSHHPLSESTRGGKPPRVEMCLFMEETGIRVYLLRTSRAGWIMPFWDSSHAL